MSGWEFKRRPSGRESGLYPIPCINKGEQLQLVRQQSTGTYTAFAGLNETYAREMLTY